MCCHQSHILPNYNKKTFFFFPSVKRELEAEAAATAVDEEARNPLLNLINSVNPELLGVLDFITLITCVLWLFSGFQRSSEGGRVFLCVRSVLHLPSDGGNVKEERERDAHQGGHSPGRLTYTHVIATSSTGPTCYIGNFELLLFLQRFSENPLEASVMMIHTFNKDREKVKGAIDIISKCAS